MHGDGLAFDHMTLRATNHQHMTHGIHLPDAVVDALVTAQEMAGLMAEADRWAKRMAAPGPLVEMRA
jgi:hypothetical protein